MERMPIWQIASVASKCPFLGSFLYVAPIAVATFLISIVLVYLTAVWPRALLFNGVFLVILLTAMAAPAATLFPVLEVQRSATLIEEDAHVHHANGHSFHRSGCAVHF